MKIVQALKEKNKLIKRILELQNRIKTYNCVIEGNPRVYDPKEEQAQLNQTIEDLISIKTRINHANQPIQEKIYRLSELKTMVLFLKAVPTTEGMAPLGKTYYTQSELHVWESSIKAKERDNQVSELEKDIDVIQKALDDHNYNTDI